MKILCGTDLSEESKAGIRLAFALADAQGDGTVEVLHVVQRELMRLDKGQELLDEVDNQTRIRRSIREWVEDVVGERDFDVDIKEGKAAEQIRARTEEIGADYVVLAQSGSGAFARLTLGSTAHRVSHDPPTATWIAKASFQEFDRSSRVIAAVDYEEASLPALHEAAALARQLDVGLVLVHIVPTAGVSVFPDGFASYPMTNAELAKSAKDAEEQMRDFLTVHAELLDGIEVHSHVLEGATVRQLVEFASNQEALAICLGASSKSRMERFFLGSIASGVVRQMPCSVLLVPAQ